MNSRKLELEARVAWLLSKGNHNSRLISKAKRKLRALDIEE